MSSTIDQTIEESPLFKHLSAERQQQLIDASNLCSFEADEIIIEEGSQARSLDIVARGRVRIWTTNDGRKVELKTLGPGGYFGEVSLLSGKDATASVAAKTDQVILVALPRAELVALVDDDDKIRRMLEGVTLARAKDTIGKVLEDPSS